MLLLLGLRATKRVMFNPCHFLNLGTVSKENAKSKSQSIVVCKTDLATDKPKQSLHVDERIENSTSKSKATSVGSRSTNTTTNKSNLVLLDDSLTYDASSIDVLSDENTTINTTTPANAALNYSYSPSATSLADLSTHHHHHQQQQQQQVTRIITTNPGTPITPTTANKNIQFNQKLKNLRRSFNSKTSTNIGKTSSKAIDCDTSFKATAVGTSSSSTNLDKSVLTSFSYMTGSNCFTNTPANATDLVESYSLSSSSVSAVNATTPQLTPGLMRKPSETNLLCIKNQIDLNVHHEKGGGFLFFSSKKKIPNQDLMLWTSQTIQKPLIKTNNKVIKKEACELFKLIQTYMGDRKVMLNASQTIGSDAVGTPSTTNKLKTSKSAIISSSSSSTSTSQPAPGYLIEQLNNSQKDAISLEIMSKGWMHPQLRDELYLQIVKQTTSNANKQSFLLGWQLMAVCLSFFPPTQKLYPFLNEYILAHSVRDPKRTSLSTSALLDDNSTVDVHTTYDSTELEFLNKLAKTCLRRLERIQVTQHTFYIRPELFELKINSFF